MRNDIVIAAGMLGALALSAGAQSMPHNYSLYTDKKAKRAEDVITVLIMENAKASNDTKTNTDKTQDASIDIKPFNVAWAGGTPSSYTPAVGFGGGVQQKYQGKGETSRAGEVKATLSARIVAVYDNGNLLIEGNKEVEVNSEKEILRVSGIVRPEDISPDNTVLSEKIADARIQYTGQGDNHQAARPGLLARFINWIF
ncbi:MAG TPA: flagellar basal body L-ring protein FlgH [Fibrobacteria bacterium]|nr:flagellar basal body L-ring protein FlgH [Fibrobacteria bacterium]